MSIKALSRKVERLHQEIKPRPKIIDCTGAHDEILAMLGYAPDSEPEPVEWSEEDMRVMQALDEILERDIERIEREYNVRFVSYER